MNILDEISLKTKERVDQDKSRTSVQDLLYKIKAASGNKPDSPAFIDALSKAGMSYICEVKKASPSKGIIAEHFPYLDIAMEYEAAGASAISCLTEPYWFKGADAYVDEITDKVRIPVLRKDFTVDEYMIYQARSIGASAVLLICAILDDVQLREYLALTHELGMDALIESHDEVELERALKAGGKIIGVNNRNLKDFTVDTANSINLRKQAPSEVLFVSESGIKTSDDIKVLRDNGVDAVLIGETLMRSEDKAAALVTLNGGPLK